MWIYFQVFVYEAGGTAAAEGALDFDIRLEYSLTLGVLADPADQVLKAAPMTTIPAVVYDAPRAEVTH